MTDREFDELMVLLDNLWGNLDAGLEAGYRYLLADEDATVVRRVVDVMAREERTWLPKAPEIAARVDRLKRQLANEARIQARLTQVALESGEPVLELESGVSA